eukprot:scaffold555981_cov34-Prasinocladus_malaysianus.AAC.1
MKHNVIMGNGLKRSAMKSNEIFTCKGAAEKGIIICGRQELKKAQVLSIRKGKWSMFDFDVSRRQRSKGSADSRIVYGQ